MPQAEARLRHLWLVEDSGPLRAVLLQLLTGMAERMSAAASVAECEQLLRLDGVPDVVISDHDLPDGTAFDVANLFAGGLPPRLIGLSANLDGALAGALRQAGFALVLNKPVRGADLREAVMGTAPRVEISCNGIPHELLERYARFVSEETRAIATAYAGLSCGKLMHHLHKLAGTASVYGDRPLARAAAACEARLRQGEPLHALRQDLTALSTVRASLCDPRLADRLPPSSGVCGKSLKR